MDHTGVLTSSDGPGGPVSPPASGRATKGRVRSREKMSTALSPRMVTAGTPARRENSQSTLTTAVGPDQCPGSQCGECVTGE